MKRFFIRNGYYGYCLENDSLFFGKKDATSNVSNIAIIPFKKSGYAPAQVNQMKGFQEVSVELFKKEFPPKFFPNLYKHFPKKKEKKFFSLKKFNGSI